VKAQLKDARKRAKASSEALLSELKGKAPVRYSAWPAGCAVRVALETPDHPGFLADDADPGLLATLVSYDATSKTIVVKLDDGTTRTLPAQRVSRERRIGPLSRSFSAVSIQASRTQTSSGKASFHSQRHDSDESPAQIVHRALGHIQESTDPSEKPHRVQRQTTSGQALQLDLDRSGPYPQMLGNPQFGPIA
jgi:hypothetical protein